MSIYVRFDSVEYDEPQFIGPFETEEDAHEARQAFILKELK